jgi:hypothetical protein
VTRDGTGRNRKSDFELGQSNPVFWCAEEKGNCKTTTILEFMKATFNSGGNTRQKSVSMRHEGNSLDSRKDNFLKLMMKFHISLRETQNCNKLCYIVLTAWRVALSFFQNPALDHESNPHLIFSPVKL